jgi:ubiquinone/menaquinone biosynthesis C-methylase UbiE
MPDDNPWAFLQPNDVARFGPVILDPAEQKRWSSALFLGGLSYMWQRATALRELIFLHLALKPGDRVLLLGEALDGSKFPDDLRARIGDGGELVCIDIIEEARNAMVEKRFGRNGKLGTWEYTYTHGTPDEHYDAVFVMQGIGHSDDWAITGRELTRVLKPGGPIMLTEIGFGPQFFAALEMDLHVEYIFRKIVAGRQRELGDAAYYSIAELQTAFAGLLTSQGSFSWRGADLFWGRKPA